MTTSLHFETLYTGIIADLKAELWALNALPDSEENDKKFHETLDLLNEYRAKLKALK